LDFSITRIELNEAAGLASVTISPMPMIEPMSYREREHTSTIANVIDVSREGTLSRETETFSFSVTRVTPAA
jgi:hypothetical protein